ncbi:MAG: pentapeptide repeat-containing protein [Bacteroidales bacterium]|jgi:uncharacterized protein YjbI with pentapeptide repeats
MSITKEQVILNLDEVKKYVSEIEEDKNKKETKKINIQIKNRFTGSIILESEKTTWKEAVEEAKANGISMREANLRGADLCEADLREADLRGADLRGAGLCEANLRGADLYGANLYGANLREANLYGANLRGAELCNAKFYGKGGTKKLKKSQLPDFLAALGFVIEEL